jgi:hypothetical protein
VETIVSPLSWFGQHVTLSNSADQPRNSAGNRRDISGIDTIEKAVEVATSANATVKINGVLLKMKAVIIA